MNVQARRTIQSKLFIGGKFVDAEDGQTIAVLNPHDNSKIADVAEAKAADIDKAVKAAQKAFPKWAALGAAERGRLLLKLADKIEENAEELAWLESIDTGHPIRDTRGLDVPRTAVTFRYFGGMADKLEGSIVPVEAGFLNYVLREPLGVVGQVVPWNFPLMFCSWKMGPALAAGNCVVMKPAELTPLSSLRIGELMAEVGFPEGVVNIVPGYGATAGQHLAEHPDVRKIAFTGSTATGRKIVEASAGNLKRVQLELGGKGANIVFDDANIKAAIGGSAFAIFHNQGQACIAGSRLLLHERIADEFLDGFLKLAKSIKRRRSARRQDRDGAAHLRDAHGPRADLLPDRASGRRRDPDRRQKARRSEARQRLLRPADRGQGAAGRPRLSGRGVRAVRLGHDLQV